MHCREFRKKHVAFVDDLLSAAEMREMRDHISVCAECAAADVRVKRSLLIVRNMPTIEPSEGFAARLQERLREAGAAPVDPPARRPHLRVAAIAAGLVLAALAARGFAPETTAPVAERSGSSVTSTAQSSLLAAALVPEPVIPDAALIAAVPTGIPVWPAVFMVGQMPLHLGSTGFVDGETDR